MSILIPGMEMPDNCLECPFKIDGDDGGICPYVSNYCADYENDRHKDCPLVPVPEHGRFGDLDDVINDVRHYLCEGCWDYFGLDAKTESCDYCRVMKLIKSIERKPSIIPAKEGEG